MLDRQDLISTFHALSLSQKYDELVTIFSSINKKNENCAYIYEKLTTTPELFDEELMERVFADVMVVYARIATEHHEGDKKMLASSAAYIQKIHAQEQQERKDDEQTIETLLTF
jgi:hypothetical protein